MAEHGTEWGYRCGCRCDPCRTAHAESEARRREGEYVADRRPSLKLTAEPWEADAACKGIDPDLMVPTTDTFLPPEAAAACAECPVKKACLDTAMRTREPWGIWGGTTPAQRQSMRRRRMRLQRRALASLRDAS